MTSTNATTARTFRKKPIEVQAVQLIEAPGSRSPEQIATWCGGRVSNNFGHPSGKVAIVIRTLEGDMTAQYGDWIIREPFPTGDRQFYPCKPDIFAATYEPVSA